MNFQKGENLTMPNPIDLINLKKWKTTEQSFFDTLTEQIRSNVPKSRTFWVNYVNLINQGALQTCCTKCALEKYQLQYFVNEALLKYSDFEAIQHNWTTSRFENTFLSSRLECLEPHLVACMYRFIVQQNEFQIEILNSNFKNLTFHRRKLENIAYHTKVRFESTHRISSCIDFHRNNWQF